MIRGSDRNSRNLAEELELEFSYKSIRSNSVYESFNASTMVEVIPTITSVIINFVMYYFNLPWVKLIEAIIKATCVILKFRQGPSRLNCNIPFINFNYLFYILSFLFSFILIYFFIVFLFIDSGSEYVETDEYFRMYSD